VLLLCVGCVWQPPINEHDDNDDDHPSTAKTFLIQAVIPWHHLLTSSCSWWSLQWLHHLGHFKNLLIAWFKFIDWWMQTERWVAANPQTKPIVSWYSFYHPTKGGRLSRSRNCSKCAQPVPKAVYRSGCRDKHNCPRCPHTTVGRANHSATATCREVTLKV